MVDLPIPDQPDVMAQAPTQRVSGNQYAHAGSFLAAGLDKLGQGLEDVAVPLAERQAADDLQRGPVTRDAQGNIAVGNQTGMPIFGKAGQAYEHAIKAGTLAGGDNLARQDLTQLAAAHPGDPPGLLKAGQAYIQNIRAHNPGPIGEAMAQRASDHLTQFYDGAVQQQAAVDVRNSKSAIVDARTNAFNTLSALAMQGGEDTPAYKKALADWQATGASLTANPAFGISKDIMASNEKDDLATLRGYHVVGLVDAAMRGPGGTEKALSDARDAISDPKLNLSVADRTKMLAMAESRVHFNTMLTASDREGARKDFGSVQEAFNKGQIPAPTPEQIEAMHQKAMSLGDTLLTKEVEGFRANVQMEGARRMLLPGQQLNANGFGASAADGNNPGGLNDGPCARSQPGYAGANGRFARFDTPASGAAAMDANLKGYASQGVTTLNQLTAKWAPAGDGKNDPVAYAKTLSAATGIDPDAKIDLTDKTVRDKILPTMTRVESGSRAGGGAPIPWDRGFFTSRSPGKDANLDPGFAPGAQAAIAAAEAATGQVANITSLRRSRQEQTALHDAYVAGTGGLAAPPGQSLHEQGRALDLGAGPVLNWLRAHVAEHPEWGVEFLSGHAGAIDPGHLQSSGGAGVAPASAGGRGIPFTPQQIKDNPFLLSNWVQAQAHDPENRAAYGEKLATGIIRGLDLGFAPDPTAAATLMQLAEGNPKLQDAATKVSAALEARNLANGLINLPPGTQELAMAAIRQQASGADLYHQSIAEQAQKFHDADVKQLADSPVGYAVSRGRAATPAPLSADNAAGLAVGMHQRGDIMDGLGKAVSPTMSVLDKDETQQMTQAIAGGSGAQIQNITSALSTLTGPRRAATIAALGPAIMGAANSGDPEKMQAAYGFMGTQYKVNPVEFSKDFGKEAANQLLAYQSLLQFMPPDVAAKRAQGWTDPAQEETRKGVAELAKGEMKGITGDQVAAKWSAFSYVNPTTWGDTKARAPSSDAAATSAQGLLEDYRQAYTFQRQLGMDAKRAEENSVKMLSTKWGVSEVNGGMVMQHPPEAHFDAINGSHDWIKQQLDAEVKGALGQGTMAAVEKAGGLAPLLTAAQRNAARTYEAPRAIAADSTTEADLAAKRPPSYYIVTKDDNGHWNPLVTYDPTTGKQPLVRFRPDPANDPSSIEAHKQATDNAAQDAAYAATAAERHRKAWTDLKGNYRPPGSPQ